ncbi:MAG: DUF1289 domain-containing protein [Proteobacteria bacterium]|nr:DUF1289 domain-containing protein [Pseudomonadota bacterium]
MGIKSPCVEVCRMDPAKAVCAGCFRTLDEIARWRDMDDPEREAVLTAIALRRARPDFLKQAC